MDIIWKKAISLIERNPDAMKAEVDKLWEQKYGSIEKFNQEQEEKHNAKTNTSITRNL